MSPRPETVKVGPLLYRVLWDADEIKRHSDARAEEGGEWAAFSNHEDLVIGINPAHHLHAQRHSLVHELLHCCLRLGGVWPDAYARLWTRGKEYGPGVEEHTVSGMAGPLLGVLMDNPHVTEWLTAAVVS
jgi:hypothetical protein